MFESKESDVEYEDKYDSKTEEIDISIRKPRRERSENTTPLPISSSLDSDVKSTIKDNKPRRRHNDGEESKDSKSAVLTGWMGSASSSINTIKIDDKEPIVSIKDRNKDKLSSIKDDDILVIPEIDEDGSDSNPKVSHAPRNTSRRLPSLQELDEDAGHSNSFNTSSVAGIEEELDLSVLTRYLLPAHMIQKENPYEIWTFESLLQDITDELVAPTRTVVSGGLPGGPGAYDSISAKGRQ